MSQPPETGPGSAEAQLASMPTSGGRIAMRRSDRAVEAIARRARDSRSDVVST
jgi:hypothetical protein